MSLAVIRTNPGPRVKTAGILAELLGIPWCELTSDGPPERLADIPYLIWTEKGDPPAAWLDRPRLVLAIPPSIRQINFVPRIEPPAPLPNGGIILRFTTDPIGEFLTCFRAALSKGPPQHFLLEEMVDAIRKAILNAIHTVNDLPYPIFKQPWWGGKTALSCVTGDVDAIRAKSFPSNLRRWLRGVVQKDKYRRNQAWRAMWRRHFPKPSQLLDLFNAPLLAHGGRGTLYWAVGSSHRLDPQYNISDPKVADLIKHWNEMGEVGLHGSFSSASHPEALMLQFQKLAEICGPPQGVRQHYLRLEGINTWQSQASLGLKYDSTLCPRKGIGITCGISTPFPLFDPFKGEELGIWELPVMMMDGALFQYEHDDMVASYPFIEHHLLRIVEAGGCVTILYHPQVLDEKVYPTVYRSYQMLIEKFAALGLDMLTGDETIGWRKALWGIKPVTCLKEKGKFQLELIADQAIRDLVLCDSNGDKLWSGNLAENQKTGFELPLHR
jgi:hypothetical protein